MTATWPRSTSFVRHRMQPTRPVARSASVPYGRVSGRMPGISPRRSRGSAGVGGLRRRFSVTRPSRSSFGARLRSRLPQYGHSVMYGLTSDPQLLQITNRSGPPLVTRSILDRARKAPGACGRASADVDGRRGDLGDDLAQVVVRLVHHELAR